MCGSPCPIPHLTPPSPSAQSVVFDHGCLRFIARAGLQAWVLCKSPVSTTPQTKQGITQLLTNIQSLCNVSYLSTLLTGVYTPRNSQKYPKMKISEEHNKTLLRERIRNLWGMIQHRHYCGKIQCQLFLSIFSLSYSLISLFIEFKILLIIYSIRILPIFKKQLNRMCSISGQHEIIDAHWSDCLFVNNKPRVTLMLWNSL